MADGCHPQMTIGDAWAHIEATLQDHINLFRHNTGMCSRIATARDTVRAYLKATPEKTND